MAIDDIPFSLPGIAWLSLSAIEYLPQLVRRHVVAHGIPDHRVDLPPLLRHGRRAECRDHQGARLYPLTFPLPPRRACRSHRLNIRLADILLAELPILAPEPRVVDVLLIAAPDGLLTDDAG